MSPSVLVVMRRLYRIPAMKRTDAASLALLAIGLAAILAGLSRIPAMSLDEAWIGMMASRLLTTGWYTPHVMNHYTGPLYEWLVAGVIAWRGPSLESLRLPGALLNAAALLGLWAHLRRRVSPEAAMAWALLCAGSTFYLLKARLAWEVYALHPVLILGTLAALASPAGGPALAALTWLGVQNHFIYLTVPGSLVVLFGARAAWRGEAEAGGRLRDAASALAAGAALALVKFPLTDEAWTAHKPAAILAMLLLPAAAAAAARLVPLEAVLRKARLPLTVFLALTTAAFIGWHLIPMVQIFAGPVVFKRLFSYAPPFLLSAPLHAWGLFLAGLLAWNAARAWHDGRMSFHERTVLLWPAAYASIFILMRHTSSLRYYSLPFLVAAVALAAALPRLAAADKRAVYGCALAAAVVAQGLLMRELVRPADRRPLDFRVGWRRENSKDFARKEALFAAFDESRACGVAHPERSFTALPLFFHRYAEPLRSCDSGLAFDADQAPDAPSAPYYRWAVLPAAK